MGNVSPNGFPFGDLDVMYGFADLITSSFMTLFAYLKNLRPDQILLLGATAASIKIRSSGGAEGHASLAELAHILSSETEVS